ncbi:MAG: threonylcarbamoyl-AMP synthase [Candidatus Gastranaerophilales bacterium]|nr:threonylcarbamoyl-AMP synthase [Candidatus Gastranaerophilales bacterium]
MLKLGEVIAFKTDTVWGFGCEVDDKIAVEKIYEIKKRDSKKPLILMSDDFECLKKYIKFIPDYAYELIEKFLPGGLTLIFEKSELCPDYITSNGSTIGVRVPDSEDFRKIISQVENRVLATTSCNVASQEPVMNYEIAKEKFENVATIIKPLSDKINENIPSTVVLCEEKNYKILRQGAVIL